MEPSDATADLASAHRALALRAHELTTLLELAEAFGQAEGRDAIAVQLALALMGGRLVRCIAVALGDASGPAPLPVVLVRGASAPCVPPHLAALGQPVDLDPADPLVGEGWRRAVPLVAGRVRRGVVLLGPSAAGAPAGAGFEAALAALAVGALEAADRTAERLQRERVDEELRLARTIQQRLLPPPSAPPEGLDVAVRWHPGREVSGDTYWAAPLGPRRVLVAVADVVGKGYAAALLMATVQAGIRMLHASLDAPDAPLDTLDLAAATARLDRLVAESTEPHQFVTLAWAVVDAEAGEAVYVVAGHPAPRLVRAAGAVDLLEAGGPLLGVVPGARWTAGRVALALGDTLVLYSDGLSETAGADAAEFGDHLDAVLAAGAGGTAEETLAHLVAAREAFGDTHEAEADDLTLVAVRRTCTAPPTLSPG